MKNVIVFILSTVAVSLAASAEAQTVNTGQTSNQGTLYVSPGTLMSVMSDFDNGDTGKYENNGEVLFRANFNNDGIITFDLTKGKGYTRFEGFLQQSISGGVPAEFYDVLFENPNNTAAEPAFRLFGNISIAGKANFLKGIVKNDDFGGLMIFEENAIHVNVNNASHVDGKVLKKGQSEFQYPIGDKGFYRYASISAPEDKASSFTAKFFADNSNNQYPHTSHEPAIELIDNNEYWVLEKTSGPANVLVTLSWDEYSTTPNEIVNNSQGDIHIVRWSPSKKLWVDQGEVLVDTFDKKVTTVLNVDRYGVFTLARVIRGIVLPENTVDVYNAVSPNGDGFNDVFRIEGLQFYPENTVEIYNRWGVLVFERERYNNDDRAFRGRSEGRVTVKQAEELPTGTYFYILKYKDTGANTYEKSGYLYINR